MAFFNKNFVAFLKSLGGNNNKEWFDKNRKTYETEVRDPFKVFIDNLIGQMNAIDPRISIQASDAIFRINRDIRFSLDKTPYKTQVSAIISPNGKKDKTFPGIYIEFSPAHIRVYSGLYMLDTKQLQKVREHIAVDPEKFLKLSREKTFVKTFGGVLGEKHKRIPSEFVEVAEKVPEIVNKQFYFYMELDPEHILDKNLDKKIMDAYRIAKPMMDYFEEPLI